MAIANTARFMFRPVVLSENRPNTSPIATTGITSQVEPSEERDERNQCGYESHDSGKRGNYIHRQGTFTKRRSMLIGIAAACIAAATGCEFLTLRLLREIGAPMRCERSVIARDSRSPGG